MADQTADTPDSGKPVSPSREDRLRGVKEQHETSILQPETGTGRETGLSDSAGAASGHLGSGGSGSTVGGPGSLGEDPARGTVGGAQGQGTQGQGTQGLAGAPGARATMSRTAGVRGEEQGPGDAAEDQRAADRSLRDGQG